MHMCSHIALVAQGLALSVIPYHPCMRTCVLFLERSLLTRLSTSSSCSSSSSSVVAARSKAKAKPQPRESTGTTTIPLRERKWIDIEPSKQDLDSNNLSKKVINLPSTQPEITSRARWSSSILQNQIPFKRLFSSNTKLVG